MSPRTSSAYTDPSSSSTPTPSSCERGARTSEPSVRPDAMSKRRMLPSRDPLTITCPYTASAATHPAWSLATCRTRYRCTAASSGPLPDRELIPLRAAGSIRSAFSALASISPHPQRRASSSTRACPARRGNRVL
eukprot:1114871-Rhodomonas_salina.1